MGHSLVRTSSTVYAGCTCDFNSHVVVVVVIIAVLASCRRHRHSRQPLLSWSSSGWCGHIVIVALAAIIVTIVMPGHCIVLLLLLFLYCHCHIFIMVVVMSLYWCAWRFIQVAGCCSRGCVISSAGRSSQAK